MLCSHRWPSAVRSAGRWGAPAADHTAINGWFLGRRMFGYNWKVFLLTLFFFPFLPYADPGARETCVAAQVGRPGRGIRVQSIGTAGRCGRTTQDAGGSANSRQDGRTTEIGHRHTADRAEPKVDRSTQRGQLTPVLTLCCVRNLSTWEAEKMKHFTCVSGHEKRGTVDSPAANAKGPVQPPQN